MVQPARERYDAYASQRIVRKLLDLQETLQDMGWSAMADAISDWRKIRFQRNNFYRLMKGTLQDDNINIIVEWLEAFHDPDISEKLKPQAIFREVGVSARDYYFHIPAGNVLDEWDAGILDAFSGVYLCAPAGDKNSFLPLPTLRRWFENRDACPEIEARGRSLDIKQYIGERTILILQRTLGSYFYAAEFPLALLAPRSFETLDIRMVYEGVGIVSSNSIHVFLRECLARVPKTHSILISRKTQNQTGNPFGLSLFLPPGAQGVREEWAKLPPGECDHLKKEYAASIDADHYLSGSAQIAVSPVAYLKNRVEMNFPREYVYHRKPADFLRDRDTHFIRPDLDLAPQIDKILANPLTIGEIL